MSASCHQLSLACVRHKRKSPPLSNATFHFASHAQVTCGDNWIGQPSACIDEGYRDG